MNVHLLDGTYELFRHYYGVPSRLAPDGREVGATIGVVSSVLGMMQGGATHLAVATDHVIESFRNDLWPGYKDGSGIDPELFQQFGLLEETLEDAGFAVWAMVELEADDGLASGVRMAADDPRVDRVFICTPDKDLAQSVVGERVVQFDRRRREMRDAEGVRDKFGIGPASIPDYLALVGDSADGFPGIPGWGAKSTATVLARYEHIDAIPPDPEDWDVTVRGSARLAQALRENHGAALLFKELATLVDDAPVVTDVDALHWDGPTEAFPARCALLGAPELAERADEAAAVAARA